jgi:hypothetical protein
MLWGPVQLFNFRFVTEKYQVLFANMISLAWNAYLSFSTRGGKPPVSSEIEPEIIDAAPMPVVLVQRMTTRVHEEMEKHHKHHREEPLNVLSSFLKTIKFSFSETISKIFFHPLSWVSQ